MMLALAILAATVDPAAHVGPHVSIGARSTIAAGASIGPGCVIGDDCEVGDGCELVARVTLVTRVRLGKRVLIHPGAVLGADGFGIAMDHGHWTKVPQLGGVVVGVEWSGWSASWLHDDVHRSARCRRGAGCRHLHRRAY